MKEIIKSKIGWLEEVGTHKLKVFFHVESALGDFEKRKASYFFFQTGDEHGY